MLSLERHARLKTLNGVLENQYLLVPGAGLEPARTFRSSGF
jgi:hypothetical protein